MRPVLACLAFALVAAPAAHASVAIPLDETSLTTQASRILVAEVISSSAWWDSRHRIILTTTTVRTIEAWKGRAPTTFTLTQEGGVIDDIEMRVLGQAAFQPGERALLFLGGHDDGLFVLGLSQGKWPMRFDQTSHDWLVERPVPPRPPAALRLPDVRSRVRRLMDGLAPVKLR